MKLSEVRTSQDLDCLDEAERDMLSVMPATKLDVLAFRLEIRDIIVAYNEATKKAYHDLLR